MELNRALSAVPLFSSLSDDQLEVVARQLRRRAYVERDVIVKRAEPGDALYIITGGMVKVSFAEDDDETIVAVLRAGDFFGELSIIDGEGRSADVIALEPTDVLILSAENFQTCLHDLPGLALSVMKELSGRLRRSTGWIRSLSSQDVYGRIAQQLLYLSESHGTDLPSNGGRRIGLRLTQNDLAGIVGASRESVNKAMGFFKSKGYITVDTTYHITVHNRAALERRCR